ncbi:TonB-dependent receptor domain-containing protein [Sphingosinicella terrae]|uniref:TonB-dependent receptor domain-containing protein n=1 Tax=Sphingosinicella terrae TaxID=2172047 RepID=UPI000E0E04A0|nr:TonB-dependent receptor [Sphingosinicella terrae]
MRRARISVAAAILLSLTSVAEAADRHRLDVPAGRLGDAIVALGRQAGISIGVSDPGLAAERVPAVRGNLTVDQALQRLLRRSPARHVALDGRTYRIMRRAATPAPPLSRRTARAAPPPQPRPEPLEIEEQIVVTATRRPVRLATYAGGAYIVHGDDPELGTGLRGSEALVARLPVVASTHLGAGRNKLFVRGIADSSFSGAIQATTGQYLGDIRLNYNAPDPDLRLYDIERVEVLAGPQGTLYGAGSLGGIIRVVPSAPRSDRVEAELSLGASATQHGDPGADGAVMANLPLVEDRLALRVVAYGASEGGYVDDTGRGLDDVNRVRILGGRARIRFETDGGWTVDVGGAAQRIRGEDGQFADRGAPPLTRESAVAQPFGSDYFLGDLTIRKDWDDLSLVTSLGAVRHEVRERFDSTLNGESPRIFFQDNDVTLLSLESRLSGRHGRVIDWILGASFVRNRSNLRRQVGDADSPSPLPGVENDAQEMALFGEARVRLAPGVIATAGGRFAHARTAGESLDIRLVVEQPLLGARADRNQSAFLPSVGLSAEAAPNMTVFARYQESFRPGGLAVSDDFIRRFRNDDLATLEAGLRYGQPGRGAFDATVSLAYTRWTDIQADTITMSGFPTTANIGDGRIYTLDMRLGWRPLPGLSLEAAALLNDSRVTNPQPSIDIVAGFPLPNVADFSARLAADYALTVGQDLDLHLSGAARYVGESRLGVGALLGEPQGEYVDISLGARLERGPYGLSLTLTNLLDEVGNRFALGSPFTLIEQRQITPLRPRTLRLGWQMRF